MTDDTNPPKEDDKTPKKATFIKAEKVYAKTKNLKVTQEKDPPRRTIINNLLTKEQRDKLAYLINEVVTHSNLIRKPLLSWWGME